MPWLETDVMKERIRFVLAYESQLYSMTELCERFGISRQTGHTIWGRYQAEGLAGLQDRPRAPQSCPHKSSNEVERALVMTRKAHPTWGPVTLLGYLRRTQPALKLP